MVILIRRDLAQLDVQLEAQEELRAMLRDKGLLETQAPPEPEPDPAESFQDDRIVTGQLVPMAECHCRASGGSAGKWKGGKKKMKKKVWRVENGE